MDKNINRDNCLIKLLLETKIKPNLSKYALEELTQMYLEFIENINNLNNKLFLEKKYSKKTIDIINLICYNIDSVENEKIQNLVFSNEPEYVKKKILINYLLELWKKIPIIDGCGEIIDCMICLNYITNYDHIYFQCEHIIHSTCFFNYLFTNLKNNNNNAINKNLIKLFRCPNCRNSLTDTINEYTKEYENLNENQINNENQNDNENQIDNENENDEYYSSIEHQYGDEFNNFIIHEYNLFANNIGNQIMNNFFRISDNLNNYHPNIYDDQINLMTIPNTIIDELDDYSTSSNSSIENISDIDTNTNTDIYDNN